MRLIRNIKSSKKLKLFLLIIGLILFLVYFLYQIIYPTMICNGKFNKVRVWTDDANKSITKLLDDEHLEVSWSLLFRRGAIIINEDRFPLFKELNGSNRLAKATTVGYEGSYSTSFLQNIRYSFSYNQITKQLSVSLTGKGEHIIDGHVGMDNLKANFIGTCQRKLF